MKFPIRAAAEAVVLTAVAFTPLYAEPPEKTTREWLATFADAWNEEAWRGRPSPGGYMRPVDDSGWKLRMQALQGLVGHGQDSIPVLLDALKADGAPQRILAAQTLGYLAPHVPHAPLLEAAKSAPDPAVRLYAVDSLGMQGAKDVDWNELLENEKNRDVRKHIGYAIERNGEPLASDVVERLTSWDSTEIDSAAVGRPAPEFELKSATGETIRLSDFRGRKPVVLVFVYGDT